MNMRSWWGKGGYPLHAKHLGYGLDHVLIRGLVQAAIKMNDSEFTTDLPENGTTETFYDYYTYDIDESINTFFWDELMPTLIVYSITLLIGIAGNSLIIFTITVYRRMKSTTNMFLASLASADLLLILICIPVKVGHINIACFA
ncbi:unnamed protein product [Nezara viridula]|uniref:G-protein coupled receptors family 1 profile domain-containing protein n=1 Tax=Nezara viridula TaxID=85310 RepID=A0A9P0MIA9_NEZVI|nr:unnamed protein product [Nezara viridula]